MKETIDLKNLTTKYSNMIYRIGLSYLNTKDNAEDIVQEVCIRYIKHIKAGNSFENDEHEKNWIIRVAVNLCCNEIASAKRRNSLEFNECLYGELDITAENLLYNALNNLKIKYKEVFILFYIEDMKISEISKVLRISETNVKKRLSRAREQIKEFIEKGDKSFERI